MLIVFLLIVLLIFVPGDLNEVVGLVINPHNDYSFQQHLLSAGVEALVSLGGKRGWRSSGQFEDSVGTKNSTETL